MNRDTQQEWEKIYKKCFQRIYEYCKHRIGNENDAMDIASEVFCLLFEKWTRYETHPEEAILAFLFRSADYKIRERGRIEEVRSGDTEIDLTTLPEKLPIDFYIKEQDKYEEYIREILLALPEKSRELFADIVINKMPYSEIAAKLQVSENTVKLRWYRIRRKLEPFVHSLINS